MTWSLCGGMTWRGSGNNAWSVCCCGSMARRRCRATNQGRLQARIAVISHGWVNTIKPVDNFHRSLDNSNKNLNGKDPTDIKKWISV